MTSFESTISCPPCPSSSSSNSIGAGVSSNGGAGSTTRPRFQTRLYRLASQQQHQQQQQQPPPDQGKLQASAQATPSGGGNGPVSLGMLTPKRKCSFSSFSECRLLEEDGENHHTFLFSIEAPSPPATPQLRSKLHIHTYREIRSTSLIMLQTHKYIVRRCNSLVTIG